MYWRPIGRLSREYDVNTIIIHEILIGNCLLIEVSFSPYDANCNTYINSRYLHVYVYTSSVYIYTPFCSL